MFNESAPFSTTKFYRTTLLAACVASSLLLIGVLLKYSAYGLDFTDEGFYLNSMATPFLYDYSHTQFGFIWHPIYRLLEGNIVLLRQTNILLSFGLAWFFCYVFLAALQPDIKHDKTVLHIVAVGVATSVLVQFEQWLLTPNYNTLALQALLLCATGLIFANKNLHRASVIGWVLIGMGGWLAFMAKASTAAALAVGTFFYLLCARKLVSWGAVLAVTVALFLLLLSAILIDGSLPGFLTRIQRSIEFGKLLDSGHTLTQILRIDRFPLSGKGKLAITLIGCLVGVSMLSACFSSSKRLFLSGFLSIAFFTITVLLIFGNFYWAINFDKFQSGLTLGLVGAAIFTCLAAGKVKSLKNISAPQWLITGLFFIFPYIYAFGTNNNYWQTGSLAAIFWLCAALIFLLPLIREQAAWKFLLPFAIATQTVTTMILQAGFEQPYRQPQPIKLNNTALTFGANISMLILSESYAKYISDAVFATKSNAFTMATPMIDLSGQSPSLLYALGAESIGQAWNVGMYPGSLALAKAAFSGVSCEKIAAAWVLFEPDGPRSIPNDLMHGLGSAFPDGYAEVATWETPKGAGGYAETRTQKLYKPIAADEILNNCNQLRVKSGS